MTLGETLFPPWLAGGAALGLASQIVVLVFAARAYGRTKRLKRALTSAEGWPAAAMGTIPSKFLELLGGIPFLLVVGATGLAVEKSRALIIQGITTADLGQKATMLSTGLHGQLAAIVVGLLGAVLTALLGLIAAGLAMSARRQTEGLRWATKFASQDRPMALAWAARPGPSAVVLSASLSTFILLGVVPIAWTAFLGTWLQLRTLDGVAGEGPTVKVALFQQAERTAATMLERGYLVASIGAVCAAVCSGLLLWFDSPERARRRILGRPVHEPPASRVHGLAFVLFLAAGALFLFARPLRRENEAAWPSGSVNDSLGAKTPELEGPDRLEVAPVVDVTSRQISLDRVPQEPTKLEASLRDYRRNFPLLHPGIPVPENILVLCSPGASTERVFQILSGARRSGFEGATFGFETARRVERPLLGSLTFRNSSAARTSLSLDGLPAEGSVTVRSDDAPTCELLSERIVGFRKRGLKVVLVVGSSPSDGYQPLQE
ncbi:MAG: hypothetical protein ABUR63_09460 [Verrucomicrobiota bacterium]